MRRSPSLALSPGGSVSRTTWRVIVVRYPLVSQSVCALVLRMPGMAAHPVPLYIMLFRQLAEALPQVHVLDRLLVGGAPAAPPPVVDPGRDALLHVEGVGVQPNAAPALERFQGADHRHQLHAVVRSLRLAAVDLLLGALGPEERAPAARTGIAAAGAVAVYLHDIVTRHGGFCGCVARRVRARAAAPFPCATAA